MQGQFKAIMLLAMTDEPIAFARMEGATRAAPRDSAGRDNSGGPVSNPRVRFDRVELNRILGLYGRMVSAGEWRDYAIDFGDETAVFSVFRRTSEMPLYRIEKRPKLKDRQGQYAVVAAGGLIMKRGSELAQVLRVLEKKLLKALS